MNKRRPEFGPVFGPQSCPLIGGHGGRRAILRFPRAWRRASANVARRWSGPQARELESWAATTGTVLRPRHRGTQTQAGSQNPAVEPPQPAPCATKTHP